MPWKKHRNPLGFHKASAPETLRPYRTSQGLCTGNVGKLTKHLHLGPPEPHRVPAPETSGTSHKVSAPEPSRTAQNPPETQQLSSLEPSGTSRGVCTRTLRNLFRNLVLKLHRIAPELIWAKDPTAKFCCWGKTHHCGKASCGDG